MATRPPITTEMLVADAVFVLQCLDQRRRDSESTQLMDVRDALAQTVTLAFSDYMRFLRRYGYVDLGRDDHTLSLSERGQGIVKTGEPRGLAKELGEYFSARLGRAPPPTDDEEVPPAPPSVPGQRPPPPPTDDEPDGLRSTIPPAAASVPPVRPASAPMFARPRESSYVPGARLGQGPFGTVFKGRHNTLGIEVALKQLTGAQLAKDRTQLAARLCYAAGKQGQLRNPGVVGVFDLDFSTEHPVIAMELCEGGNLRERWKTVAPRPRPAVILRAFAQILDALAVAHESGLVHGNIKPENVMFDRYGNAKLADFGFDSLRDSGTTPGAGLLDYIPVDQRKRSGASTDASADVYAVGTMLYEALVGRLPQGQARGMSSQVNGVPSALDWVVDQMTAEDVVRRYRVAGDAFKDFLSAAGDAQWRDIGRSVVSTRVAKDAGSTAPQAVRQ